MARRKGRDLAATFDRLPVTPTGQDVRELVLANFTFLS